MVLSVGRTIGKYHRDGLSKFVVYETHNKFSQIIADNLLTKEQLRQVMQTKAY